MPADRPLPHFLEDHVLATTTGPTLITNGLPPIPKFSPPKKPPPPPPPPNAPTTVPLPSCVTSRH